MSTKTSARKSAKSAKNRKEPLQSSKLQAAKKSTRVATARGKIARKVDRAMSREVMSAGDLQAQARGSRAGMGLRRLNARYDAAQTTTENKKHWAMADGFSANLASSVGVRRILRNRARYEVANNSYAEGLITTLSNDCIGNGPRLQLAGSNLSAEDKSFVEEQFAEWALAIDLPEKLRSMRSARCVDGEAFGLKIFNPILPTPVQLDLRLIEAEQVASPAVQIIDINHIDGMHFDAHGNPQSYDILKNHPGDGFGIIVGEFLNYPAADVIHAFVPKRAGQRRGVPELTPALPLFAQLRRWTLSVLAAAETASDFAAIMYTENPPDGESKDAEPFDNIEIERRMMMTVPAGWKMEQFDAKQPISTYAAFKREIIGEIARCLQVPLNVALGDSSGFNYASGRLDHQVYFKQLRVDRARMISQIVDRLFKAWREEAILIENYLPQSLRNVKTDWSHRWLWDGAEHVDPLKEANAQTVRLDNLTTTHADEWGKQGQDWEKKFEQIAREKAKVKELEAEFGVTLSVLSPGVTIPVPGGSAAPGLPGAPATPGAKAPAKNADTTEDNGENEPADDEEPDVEAVRDERGMLLGIRAVGKKIVRDARGRIVGLRAWHD